MSTTLSLDVTVRRQPRAVTLDLTGEINAAAEETLNAGYAQAERDDPEVIVVNFARVDYMNSTGIALIVGLLARARKNRRRLVACGLSPHYQEIFAVTRLVDYMPLFADEASALTSRVDA